jgi:hypothetical protein
MRSPSKAGGRRPTAELCVDMAHPVFPIVAHRLCIDHFLHHAAWVFALLTAGWAAVGGFFAVGATPYFYGTASIALSLVLVLWYGEWALTERLHREGFAYLCVLWWLLVALLWCASAGFVHIRASQEYTEENWYALQTAIIIPFTTMLDQKQQLSDNATGVFALALVTVFLHLLPAAEAWRALGGVMRFSQLLAGALVPDLVAVFCVAAATASYAVFAALVAPYATAFGTGIMLWQAACALLVLVAVLGQVAARAAWGACFLQHALAASVMAPLAFSQFVLSWALYVRAGTVDDFLATRWSNGVQYLVPPAYAAQSVDKYAVACQTAMRQSAAAGFLLAALCACSVGLGLHCGAVLLSLGADAQAYMTRSELRAQSSTLLARMHAAAAEIVDMARGREPALRAPLVDAADADAGAAAPEGFGAGVSKSGLFAAGGAGNYGSAGGSLLRGANAKQQLGASAADELAAARAQAFGQQGKLAPAGGVGGLLASVPLAPALLLSPEERARREKRREELMASISRAQLEALQQDRYLMLVYERQVEELRAKVACPTPGNFCRAFGYYAREAAVTSRCCLAAAAVALVACIGGIAGGLADVAVLGQCAPLAYAPQTVYYSTNITIESGDVHPYATLLLENLYPFGGLELDIEHVPVGYTDRNNTVTMQLWAFGANAADLPTPAQLAALVQIGDFLPQQDDDPGGFGSVSAVAVPPADARKRCLGMRLRLSGEAGKLIVQLRSSSGLVNVTGNIADLTKNNAAPFAFQTLVVTTDTAPVVMANVYVDKKGLAQDYPNFDFPPSLNVTSGSGDVFLDLVTSSGVAVTTSGSIYSNTVGSFSFFNCAGICGDVNLTTTGTGKIVVVQAFGGNNAYLRTEHGAIVAANTGMIVGRNMRLESVDGPITMANFLQAFNNETFVSSAGKITGSVVITNRMTVRALGSASVAFIELFAGCPAPGKDLFKPPVEGNYSAPMADISVDKGDIQILGIGGSPASSAYANVMSLYLRSGVGKIKVEVNGGGLNGNYTAHSNRGRTTVEVDGRPGATTGVFGNNVGGANEIVIESQDGNVQVGVLPSPI